ncbi:MAG: hypothetical protein E6R13_08055 [Spirochaetes bacterium]|nr:MAG: hypothetical protein E6R13_08055 [Spirochaetota bacterium]
MGLGPTPFQKFMDILSSIGVPALAITWIIAMIKLWKWNSEASGVWFAFAMVFLGFLTLCLSIAQTFNLWDKFMAYLDKRKQNKNKK